MIKKRTGIHIIALFELLKGSLVLLAGLGLLTLIDTDLQDFGEQVIGVFHLNPAQHYPRIFLDFLDRVSDMNFFLLALGAFAYSVIRFAEAYGLWKQKIWAEWMAILSGAAYLPVEIYEMTKLINWPRILVTSVNFGVVLYLVRIKFWKDTQAMEISKNRPQTVVILGASNNPERYSYRAFKLLQQYGHKIILVSPKMKELEKNPVVANLSDISANVDTLTMYVGPDRSTALQTQILKLKPKRVIFNPGSENPALQAQLANADIEVLEACTLVLLSTNQFNRHG